MEVDVVQADSILYKLDWLFYCHVSANYQFEIHMHQSISDLECGYFAFSCLKTELKQFIWNK